MRIYTPLSENQKNMLSQRAKERAIKKYPTGLRLKKLTVIGHVRMFCKEAKNARSYWGLKCRCDCGKEIIVRATTLSGKGKSQSCGCVGVQKRIEASKRVWMLPPGEAALRAVYSHIQRDAASRRIPFELSLDQFRHKSIQNCTYCGSSPSKSYGTTAKGKPRLNGVFVFNGLDRLNSLLGYTVENTTPCCKHCNYAKHKMTVDEFKAWLRRTATHFLGMS